MTWRGSVVLLQLLLAIQGLVASDSTTGGVAEPKLYTTKAFVGEAAPQFQGYAAVNFQITEISLKQYAGQYVVLVFYPRDFTSVCISEIRAYNNLDKEFRQHNAQVIVASSDSEIVHLVMVGNARREGIVNYTIPLLSDSTHQIAKDYGVHIEEFGHPQRATFIIDGTGTIRHITVNDLGIGRNVDESLRMVQALQYADENDEDCEAGWQPKPQRKANKKGEL